jgi:hypothetical protein
MSISRKTQSLMLGLGLAISISSAQAAMVNFTLTGDVDTAADPGNVFGLVLGNTITATGTFDDSVLTLGTGTVSFHDGSGNSITLNVGNLTYTASDDYNFLSIGFPNLSLAGGAFTGLNFATDPFAPTSFDSLDSFFDGYEDDGFTQTLSGTWDSASFQMTPVPVPAAVWLLGSGLLGLVGVARRKTAVR